MRNGDGECLVKWALVRVGAAFGNKKSLPLFINFFDTTKQPKKDRNNFTSDNIHGSKEC